MTNANVELVREAIRQFNEIGFDGIVSSELISDEIEFHEPPEQPAPRVARGRDAVHELASEFDAAWAEHKSEPEEIISVDRNRVLLISVETFTGRDGIDVSAPFAAIFTINEGKIVRWQAYWNRDEAFKAIGPV